MDGAVRTRRHDAESPGWLLIVFDFVVVGGGSAGCIAASELADAGHRVLLLEAGPAAEAHPETLHADGYKDAFRNDAVIWDRFSEPQRHAGGQRVFMGTGSVLGGSGSVNGMVYTRGARLDYEEWPAGWRWDDVASDFEALEARLRVRRRAPTRWTEACIRAAEHCGFERRDDLNDGHLSNVIGYEWMSYEGDRRRSSYVAFIQDAPRRDNLTVLTGARALQIGFAGRKAAWIRYEHDGVVKRDNVGAVLLAAGALETPKLLMVSGVGPAAELAGHGIDVVADRPEVGENLHDHPNVPVFFHSKEHVDCLYPQLYSFFRTNPDAPLPAEQSDTCYVFWPAPSAMKEATQRMLPAQVLPEALYDTAAKHLLRGAIETAFKLGAVRRFVDHLFGIIIILGKPASRGRLRLRSRDARDQAHLDPAYFSVPSDMETMVRGVHKARELARAPGLADIGSRELMPGSWVKRGRRHRALHPKERHHHLPLRRHLPHGRGRRRRRRSAPSRARPRQRVGRRRIRRPHHPVSAMNAPSMLVGLRAARYALR